MITQSKQTLEQMTPEKALELLKTGNQRFLEKKQEERDLLSRHPSPVQASTPLPLSWAALTPECRRSWSLTWASAMYSASGSPGILLMRTFSVRWSLPPRS